MGVVGSAVVVVAVMGTTLPLMTVRPLPPVVRLAVVLLSLFVGSLLLLLVPLTTATVTVGSRGVDGVGVGAGAVVDKLGLVVGTVRAGTVGSVELLATSVVVVLVGAKAGLGWLVRVAVAGALMVAEAVRASALSVGARAGMKAPVGTKTGAVTDSCRDSVDGDEGRDDAATGTTGTTLEAALSLLGGTSLVTAAIVEVMIPA